MASVDERDNVAEEIPTATTPSAVRDDLKEYPGRTLGVVALVFAFFSQLPALVMGIIAWVWSNKAGHNNVPAKVAVAVSASLLVLIVLAIIGWTALLVSFGEGLDFGGPGMRGWSD